MKTSSVFTKNVSNLDCAIFDPKHGIVGQSWGVDICLDGNIAEYGFIYDFSKLKPLAKEVVDSIDHKLLIIPSLPIKIQEINEDGFDYRIDLTTDNFIWKYFCPKSAIKILDPFLDEGINDRDIYEFSTHSIKKCLEDILDKKDLGCSNILERTLSLEHEKDEDASFFCYTHGLSEYEGNCQRPFHGHRSKIIIYQNGVRRKDLEIKMVSKYYNVHMCSTDQIQESNDYSTTLEYTGSQGKYRAVIPTSKILNIGKSSSIENFAMYLVKDLYDNFKEKDIRVLLSEGIGKGIIFEI